MLENPALTASTHTTNATQITTYLSEMKTRAPQERGRGAYVPNVPIVSRNQENRAGGTQGRDKSWG